MRNDSPDDQELSILPSADHAADAAPSPTLFDPIDLRNLRARNRIWVAPMCQYSVHTHDGIPNDWHLVHLGGFAKGGAGLILTEATAVSPDGRISLQDTGLWNDAQRDAWQPITAFVRSQGALIGVQLSHAGRKGSVHSKEAANREGPLSSDEGGWLTTAPSEIAFGPLPAPRALDAAEIPAIVSIFTDAARRAMDAGFDLVEIHAAHGYLLHQFLSPLSNHRRDEYGGSLANRACLLLEVVEAVRHTIGDAPLFVRFSATDWADGGWDVEATATVAGWAREAGADFADISTGGLIPGVSIPVELGYQVPFAEHVRTVAGVDASAVGLITDPSYLAQLIAEGRADAVFLGREMLRDPHFALRAAADMSIDIDYWPAQYLRARPRRR